MAFGLDTADAALPVLLVRGLAAFAGDLVTAQQLECTLP